MLLVFLHRPKMKINQEKYSIMSRIDLVIYVPIYACFHASKPVAYLTQSKGMWVQVDGIIISDEAVVPSGFNMRNF